MDVGKSPKGDYLDLDQIELIKGKARTERVSLELEGYLGLLEQPIKDLTVT